MILLKATDVLPAEPEPSLQPSSSCNLVQRAKLWALSSSLQLRDSRDADISPSLQLLRAFFSNHSFPSSGSQNVDALLDSPTVILSKTGRVAPFPKPRHHQKEKKLSAGQVKPNVVHSTSVLIEIPAVKDRFYYL